jgi:hypothetical protein
MPVLLSEGVDASTAVVNGLTSAASTMSSMISSVVPIALGVVGTVIAVKFGIRFFKSIAK